MNSTNEIKALLHLLDDPDETIYQSVFDKIIQHGIAIIPFLESRLFDEITLLEQERIQQLIYKINFNEVEILLSEWFQNPQASLVDGAILLSKFNDHLSDENLIRKTIKSIHQSCWLELNNYLTPLEQINLVNSIFYSMYKFSGFELEVNNPNHYFLGNVLETKEGNNYSLGILYQILCEMLDIPVFAIQLPKQFILAYFSTDIDFYKKQDTELKIQFYINPLNGDIHSQNDVEVYLKKYNLKTDEDTFLPLHNHEIISNLIESLCMTYELNHEEQKANDLSNIVVKRFQ